MHTLFCITTVKKIRERAEKSNMQEQVVKNYLSNPIFFFNRHLKWVFPLGRPALVWAAFTKKSVFLRLPDLQVQQNADFMKERKDFSAISTVLFLTIPLFCIGPLPLSSLKSDTLFFASGIHQQPIFRVYARAERLLAIMLSSLLPAILTLNHISFSHRKVIRTAFIKKDTAQLMLHYWLNRSYEKYRFFSKSCLAGEPQNNLF